MIVEHTPLLSISAHNWSRPNLVAVVLKAYYDGSKDENEGKLLTLRGYVGTFDAWAFLEERWHHVLERWDYPCLHMTDADALRGDFREKGDGLESGFIS